MGKIEIDGFNREGLTIEVGFSLPAARVIRVLDQVIEWRGNSQQNAYVERYNRTVRYEWLGQHLFASIEQVQQHATEWLWTYSNERPNMVLGGITPKQKLALTT